MKISYTLKWILQKILAIVFFSAATYVIFSLSKLDIKDYEIITLWFKSQINSLVVFILYTSIIFHSNIGLSSIIDDYFHDQAIRGRIILIKNFFFAVLFFITIFSLVRLIFNE